jgi:hypothetical protein
VKVTNTADAFMKIGKNTKLKSVVVQQKGDENKNEKPKGLVS